MSLSSTHILYIQALVGGIGMNATPLTRIVNLPLHGGSRIYSSRRRDPQGQAGRVAPIAHGHANMMKQNVGLIGSDTTTHRLTDHRSELSRRAAVRRGAEQRVLYLPVAGYSCE